MDLNVWLALLTACFFFSASPGPAIFSCVSYALSRGFKECVINALGLQTANMLHLAVVSFGLGALIATSATIFMIMKYLGAAYLIFLGVRKWIEEPRLGEKLKADLETQGERSGWLIFGSGVLFNLFNPKSIIFLAAFIPNFIQPGYDPTLQFAIVAATMVGLDLVILAVYGFFAAHFRAAFNNERKMVLQNRFFGVVFAGAGVLLAMQSHEAPRPAV